MTSDLWIKGVVFIILGLIACIAGVVMKLYAATRRPYPGYAEARVVDIISVERDRYAESRFRNRQAAVFEFYANGKLIKIVDREDSYPCPYHLYQKVRLCYDPADPEQYRVITAERERTLSVVLNAVGIVLILIGVLIFILYASRFIL
ncbi:MAG: DUF3592 domain-containing protein [Lachnospiraceae bacterium]|nr:DUF3592 domain-containing protein [Lachnospiraceae bacterium]